MHVDDLEKILDRRPFQPFRLTVSTQEFFDVRHPDAAILDERFLAVGTSARGSSPEDYMVVYWIDVNHIVHLRRLEKERS